MLKKTTTGMTAGMTRQGVGFAVAGGGGPTYLLDTYSGAAAAYSLRRLSTAYTGPVVRVVESSKSREANFTAEEVADGTLAAWVGAGNDGTVKTLYDQSTNGTDLSQTTLLLQPTIVSAGSIVTRNGKPAISYPPNCYLTTSSAILNDADCTAFCVYSSSGNGMFAAEAPLGSVFFLVTQSGSATSCFTGMGSPSVRVNGSAIAATRGALYSALGTDVQSLVTAQAVDFQGMTTFAIDGYQGGFTGLQTQQEFVLYPSASVSDATAIESNIATHYGITLP